MKLSILIGGQAGQGPNTISGIIAKILVKYGYYIFDYRDYESLIRGGHNFNILSFSENQIAGFESKVDGIIALDENTISLHKKKNRGFLITYKGFEELGRNMNLALAGALAKIIGIEENDFLETLKENFGDSSLEAGKKGFTSQEKKFELKKTDKKIEIMSGSKAVAVGAVNSNLDLYIGYPMTPATPVLSELASEQLKNKNLFVFQAENEISVVNAGLGASFAGSKVMIGTSGGGFDLMTEALSLQGMSEIPLTVYLASRPGPGTGLPTHTSQGDLNIALKSGHGEFPRVVIAPGDAIECMEKTNEAIYLANKFNSLSILLSDKHLAESQFSFINNTNKPLKIPINRKIPSKTGIFKTIVKANSYEHDKLGNTTEDAETARKNAENRIKKYEQIKKESEKFEMIKLHGNEKSKNLLISWGSTKGEILDAISDLDVKFLQILYIKPMSNKIIEEIKKSENIILIENNSTGQLGRYIREKTGYKIEKENRILKYDGRCFNSDELKEEIRKRLK